MMRMKAFAVLAVLLFAATALAGGKIVVDNQTIEFSPTQGKGNENKSDVKHNGVAKGVAKEVKIGNVFVPLDNGTVLKHDQVKDMFIVYRVNPTCVTYWNGRTWVQYCW